MFTKVKDKIGKWANRSKKVLVLIAARHFSMTTQGGKRGKLKLQIKQVVIEKWIE